VVGGPGGCHCVEIRRFGNSLGVGLVGVGLEFESLEAELLERPVGEERECASGDPASACPWGRPSRRGWRACLANRALGLCNPAGEINLSDPDSRNVKTTRRHAKAVEVVFDPERPSVAVISGARLAGRNDAEFVGEDHRLYSASERELLEDVGDVGLDGTDANYKPFGDLVVR
jgi:hypothetical protein